MADIAASEKEYCDKLLRIVKREVKQIMEEAVTRKFVHEESSTITSLCAAVDACLSHGLKRRALGLFKTNSTTALLQKVAKSSDSAAIVLRIITEIENADPNKRSSSSSDSINKFRGTQKQQNSTVKPVTYNPRYFWIRIALFEKHLVDIVDHVVQNSNKYYEKDALVSDPVFGQILASLLVGPCALDYSKMKTQDHFWTDPPADELVQRHRLSGPITNGPSTPPGGRKPLGLHGFKRGTIDTSKPSYSTDDNSGSSPPIGRASLGSPHDYVDSLHQNSRSTLLYGKNNVVIQPCENIEPMPGYLSLHQIPVGLIIKWTPNQLMNGCCSNIGEEHDDSTNNQDKSIFWNYAMSVSVEEIVYLHCHQNESSGTIVLVGQDGVQRPPIRFPKGGHLLAFLSCMENGLLPYGQLDPPLWSQRGRGKVFPRLKRRGRGSVKSKKEQTLTNDEEDSETMDYVFRIISTFEKPDTISQEMLDPNLTKTGSNLWTLHNRAKPRPSTSSSTSSTISVKSLNGDHQLKCAQIQNDNATDKSHIKILCESMKRQIISRAFYGWLAHCRHLRTVRTHLSGLVNTYIIRLDEPCDASKGMTEEIWNSMQTSDGKIQNSDEVYRLIYFGGMKHNLRRIIWPYLLGHYDFASTECERKERDKDVRQQYEMTMSEWLAVEAIVRQRDKEIMAANLAKLSSESTTSVEIPLTGPKDTNMSNDVFEDSSDSDSKSSPKNSKSNQNQHSDSPKHVSTTRKQQLQRHKKVESQNSSNIIVTNPSVDASVGDIMDKVTTNIELKEQILEEPEGHLNTDSGSACVSPASSAGGVYTNELLDLFSLNLHRIDKDVQRCDRNFWYFTNENLEKLRNVMCTYVWEHLDIGYVQGMCDLVAPLLVIYDDEMLSYSCFCELMKRMVSNFPHGGAMDTHFANMRSLIQILDSEIFELMHQNGDYTHFYFCYRWFLLDFKRELVYDDVFIVWETIWAAKYISSPNFVLFIALALVEYYRDIILGNNMDFTDIIKFFNEMAEHHDAKAVLKIARDLVLQIQTLIDNK